MSGCIGLLHGGGRSVPLRPFAFGEGGRVSRLFDGRRIVSSHGNDRVGCNSIIYITIYVYASYDASGTHKFTPLAKLVDKDNYEANKYVKLYFKDEVRRYEVAYVYYCELIEDEYEGEKFSYTEDGFEFYYPNYSEEQFNKYIDTVKKNAFYDTGVSITYNDKLLTLQTCVENHDELREIVLLKEIDRTSYN